MKREVIHDTVRIKRRFPAARADVFRAWRDPRILERWYAPGDESWSMKVLVHDFRVGGLKQLRFGPPGEVPMFEDCRYEDIVADDRLCFSMTISQGETRITTSMVTVEFRQEARETLVVVTDQLAVLDGGDTARDRERGWGECLDKLQGVFIGAPQ